ncbi:hypothetical protein GH714_014564 [Hevea brasiliensis]|uniref:DDHD domain-containing protein n=1 Tax=Hevea brasiliensis TaxID=3981 RepID=A0A6A6LKR1_HEVBR|nr:hypothetical protein GH714_014564 [Hevea brasiliensis]
MADSKANPDVTEETSPDLLKNTPGNIARLEDVIEHSKGRQKYLAQTRSPSDGSDVRWYFCKAPLAENELAASIPRTEIVGKGDYFRFGMRDSLAIEASFLQREEELLSSWWKEFAECTEGPGSRFTSRNKLDEHKSAYSIESAQAAQLYEAEEERVGVPVKGGLYEVDLVKRHCFPVYWNGENRRVLRGHWFAHKGSLDWLPLREDIAEQLEIAYCSQGLHALFTGEDNTWEAWLNVDASSFSSIISLSGNGIKLRRGYSASQSAKPTQVPVRHVVFMVHGIGQRLEKSNLVDDVGSFRHITASLAERHLTAHQRGAQRVLFIPCQWRKDLKLSGETAVEKITLDGVRGESILTISNGLDVQEHARSDQSSLDMTNQSSVGDSSTNLEGNTPVCLMEQWKKQILFMKKGQMNNLLQYVLNGHASDFPTIPNQLVDDLEELPAIALDSKQKSEKSDDELGEDYNGTSNKDKAIKLLREEIDSLKAKIAKLESQSSVRIYVVGCLKVDTFFAVGSPLGVFLALRNIRIGIDFSYVFIPLTKLYS